MKNKKIKSKLIIHNYSDFNDYSVMNYISTVISRGKISETSKGKQYCFVSQFPGNVFVSSGRNKDTYTFYIERRDTNDK